MAVIQIQMSMKNLWAYEFPINQPAVRASDDISDRMRDSLPGRARKRASFLVICMFNAKVVK